MSERKNYGLPPRPLPSTTLWAHLLKKGSIAPPPGSAIIPPPITPLDKTATSTRILLHDTQAHLEKFSSRIDKMLLTIDETKREISTVNNLFQREHETLTGDMIDLVNRSQTEVQKSLGKPSQENQLEHLSLDLQRRLDTLDKRLDAIHAFNQTHSQTLQLQSQALQTLQDKQGSMMSMLTPLLPLIQAMPLHIESARNHIKDILRDSKCTEASSYGLSNPDRTPRSLALRNDKRSSSTLGSNPSSPSPFSRKRSRIDKDNSPRTTRTTTKLTSAAANIQVGDLVSHSPKRPQALFSSRPASIRQITPQLKTPSSAALSLVRHRTASTNYGTPRRPLNELFATRTTTNFTAITRTSTLESLTTKARHQPHTSSPHSLVHSSPYFRVPPIVEQSSLLPRVHITNGDIRAARNAVTAMSATSDPDTHQKQVHPASTVGQEFRTSEPYTPASSTRLSQPTVMIPKIQDSSFVPPSTPSAAGHNISVSRDPFLRSVQIDLPHPNARTTVGHGSSTNPLMPATKSALMGNRVRERRSPLREGRRFIPLGDSDDDEDEDED